ncbi:putative aldouronate transport system permease protein [Paenibacillus mucilaginosus]|uniref:carbohydrate ABC transporter permease n=1 Tax=Paenibacillus mucilaginosus TaxID=61624 RepID=UPI003D208EA4
MYYKSPSYRAAYVLILAFLGLLALICLLPAVHLLAVSLSGKAPAAANLVTLWPMDFTWASYQKTLSNENFLRSLWNTAERVLLGVGLGMMLTVVTAYPLSKDDRIFPQRSRYIWFFVVTMLFSGGLVPNYILIRMLHLTDTVWALLLPALVNVWNILLLLNFFRTLPKELEEAALMDGAGHWRTLFSVYLPVSLPAIVTLSLFTMVTHWNSWFDGMIYMKQANWPLATLLQSIIVQVDFTKLASNPAELSELSDRSLKASQIFIGALPVLVLYPFLQRYFVKGVVIGAVKE